MFAALGRFTYRRRGLVLLLAGLFAVLAAAFGPAVADDVRSGGFEDAGAESTLAADALTEAFGPGADDVIVIWRNETLTPDDPEYAAQLTPVLAALPAEDVTGVVHPFMSGLPDEVRAGLVGADGHTVMAALTLAGDTTEEILDSYEDIRDDLTAPEGWTTDIAGTYPVYAVMQATSESDIARAEMIAMPILLVLMAVIFGSLVAAFLPAVTGGIAILGAMLLLRGIAQVTDVSTFALNVATILGLGLAIDYSLFVVSRFREEIARDGDVARSVSRTVATAGRTVAFSGLTVLIAFCGLLFFPQMFLKSMGLGGIAVVLVDVTLALTLLPALLGWLGPRVDSGRLPTSLTARVFGRRPRGERTRRTEDTGAWARLAGFVLRRPWPVVLGATVLLAVIAAPALDLVAGETDVSDLPASAEVHQASDLLAEQFPHTAATTLDLVILGDPGQDELAGYLTAVDELPGTTSVEVVGQQAGVTHAEVRTDGTPSAPATTDLVHDLRDLAGPGGLGVLVGGSGAASVDSVAAITRVLPWTLLFVAGVTLVLLFAALGSVVLPIKAVVMNIASLAATVGVISWGFSEGHLSGLLGFAPTGKVEAANLVLIGLIAFGLAMDYELFLLSRVREERMLGTDEPTSIARGLQRSGRTITSAALLLVVVLAAMATSSVTFLKLIGLGLAFAVALDATVVRALLVPATMRLLGRANWWLPAPLARLYARIDIGEVEPPDLDYDDVASERELVSARD
jgi:uncharacterized membrane protein YdfJ with MMPL/SSD domain